MTFHDSVLQAAKQENYRISRSGNGDGESRSRITWSPSTNGHSDLTVWYIPFCNCSKHFWLWLSPFPIHSVSWQLVERNSRTEGRKERRSRAHFRGYQNNTHWNLFIMSSLKAWTSRASRTELDCDNYYSSSVRCDGVGFADLRWLPAAAPDYWIASVFMSRFHGD